VIIVEVLVQTYLPYLHVLYHTLTHYLHITYTLLTHYLHTHSLTHITCPLNTQNTSLLPHVVVLGDVRFETVTALTELVNNAQKSD
jgi:hypothetical protein